MGVWTAFAMWRGPVSLEMWSAAISSRAASSKRFVCPIRFTVYGEEASFRMASPMGISPLEPAMTVVILSSASFLASSPQYSMGHFLWSPRVPGTRRT